jgi:dipeptidyl aminopeptidase/acylaminoacyl peptidase
MGRSANLHRSACLAALLVCAASIAAAQDVFTPHHVAKLRLVTSVATSPDGSEIAYVLSVPRTPLVGEDGAAWEELHVVSADGASRAFVTGQVNVAAPRWTPDGQHLLFLARRAGDDTRALYLLPRNGGEARRLVSHETDIVAFDISGDGRQVAFLARAAVPKARQDLARRGFNQEVFEETVEPVRVWVAALDNTAAGEARLLDLPGSASVATWDPAGSRLMVISAPTPLVDDDLMMRRVHIVDAAGGKVIGKIDNPGKIGQVSWSPDGDTLAMVSAADVNDPAEGRLMVVPATGGSLRDLLPQYEAHVRGFAWKDAATLVYFADEGVESAIGEVRRDGSAPRTLVAPGEGPIVTALDRGRSGAIAIIAETPRHPSEVFLLSPVDGAPRRLTEVNPWLATMRLAPQEVVTFKARDGLSLQGILIRPLDIPPGQRVPLILTVHGGPEARDAQGWRTSYANPGQVAAAQGFAVFYPNYRGSTGRGVAFSKLSQGDPAGKEFDDLVDAVDHLVGAGLVDRDKVGITGGSYGGYASAWGATYYTDRFAAAVMFVGISDKVSKVGTTDIANEEYLVHALKRPWEAWDAFRERSPIYHAGQSRTPTLILHGTADPRVHPTQSLSLYRYLKLHGKTPVRLVWYPGEGHGNRRAASRLDYNLRLMRWMTHYLKGPGGAPPPVDLDYQSTASPPPPTRQR